MIIINWKLFEKIIYLSYKAKVVGLSWNFVNFHETLNQAFILSEIPKFEHTDNQGTQIYGSFYIHNQFMHVFLFSIIN